MDEPTEPPLISIVVPAFNCAAFLPALLESVIAQRERRWEAIVVDDGSTDATADVVEEFAARDGRFRFWRQPNAGPSAARNAGYRASDERSRYVTFMDADDVWLPHALEDLLACCEAHPEAVGSHGLAELVDADGQVVEPGAYPARGRARLGRRGRRLVPWPPREPTTFDVLVNGNVLFPPGLLLARRSAYATVGPFDTRFKGPEDWDMLIRLSRLGPLQFVDEVILHYRRHDRNLGAAPGVAEQAWRVRCKAFHSPENSPEQQRAARRGWRAYQILMAEQASRAAWRALTCGHVRTAVHESLRVVASAVRFVRGFPTPRLRTEPLRW